MKERDVIIGGTMAVYGWGMIGVDQPLVAGEVAI